MTSVPSFRFERAGNPAAALGLAVNHLMTKPAFARLPFGEWSRVLTGQINRGHYWLVTGDGNRVAGFAGWCYASRERADAWLRGEDALGGQAGRVGECVVFNAWSADGPEAQKAMASKLRRAFPDKDYFYFKRHYPDGRIRTSVVPLFHPMGDSKAA